MMETLATGDRVVQEAGQVAQPGDELHLALLVAQRPEVHPVAAGLGVARHELGAPLRRPDAEDVAQRVRVPPEQGSQDVVEMPARVVVVLGHPRPHRHHGGRQLGRELGPSGGERDRIGVVRRGQPAVTVPSHPPQAGR